MITLQKHPDNVELCKLKQGNKTIPVYWHPVRNPALRMAVTDVGGFDTEEFRDRFRLSKNQSADILKHLRNQTTPEDKLQNTFFKVKRWVEDNLFNEMNLSGSSQELQLDYPSGNDTWAELYLICGASSCGKTHWCMNQPLNNLKVNNKTRRRFVVISNDWNRDCTLDPLKKERFHGFVKGIDISESSLANSPHASAHDFFENEVKPTLDHCRPGTVCVIDDFQDSCCSLQLRSHINKMLRTSRHDSIGLMFILHAIRSGHYSATASSNCKYFVLFPRSQKGKIREFLVKDLGCTLAEARDHVHDFAQSGRSMTVRLFSPQCLIGPKLIRLL